MRLTFKKRGEQESLKEAARCHGSGVDWSPVLQIRLVGCMSPKGNSTLHVASQIPFTITGNLNLQRALQPKHTCSSVVDWTNRPPEPANILEHK